MGGLSPTICGLFLCHLRASIDCAAGQVLWDAAGRQSSADEVIKLLKSRFGTYNEKERYRSELRSRRRRRSESLQGLYRDFRRLMALAFPSQSDSLWELMARYVFIDALGDPDLPLRVLERAPSSLEETLKVASHLEALSLGKKGLGTVLGRLRQTKGSSRAVGNSTAGRGRHEAPP